MAEAMEVGQLLGGKLRSRPQNPGTPDADASSGDSSGNNPESGEGDSLDASENLDEERRGADDAGGGEDEAVGEGEGADNESDSSSGSGASTQGEELKTLPAWAQTLIADMEEKRKGFQSETAKAHNDVRNALDEIQKFREESEAGYSDEALNLLEGKEDGDVVEVGDIRKILEKQEQQGDQKEAQEKLRLYNSKVNSALNSKDDMSDVHAHYRENNLSKEPDAEVMTKLGNYYFGLSHLRESQLKTQKAEHQTALKKAVKEAEARGKKNASRPPVAGGNAGDGPNSLSVMEQKLKDRAKRIGTDYKTGERVAK